MTLRQSLAGFALLAVLLLSAAPLVVFAQDTAEPPPQTTDSGDTTTDTPTENTSQTTVTPQQTATDNNVVFIPLTGIPGVKDISGANSIADFLNVLYRLCVGVAATLAVIQIIRGGVSWMRSDSITGHKESRELIKSAVFGLVLVLSPVIVFGLIDPRILNLNLDASQLKLDGGSTLGSMGGDTRSMSEEQLAVFKDDLRRILEQCSIPATTENVDCVADDIANTASCFTPALTDTQRTCLAEKSIAEANKCESVDVHEGTIVQSDFRSCCVDAGFNAVQNHNSSSYTCTHTTPEEEYSLEAAAGSYNFVLYGLSSDESCIQLVHGSYPDQNACTAGLNAAKTERPSYEPFYQCTQPPLPATIFNKPVCSDVETLP